MSEEFGPAQSLNGPAQNLKQWHDNLENLHWHALNYRTASPQHAEAMWQELLAFVDRKIAAERERWLIAFSSARDMVLHDRGPLAEQGMDSDKTNAVLAVLDDCFVELT